MPRTLSLSGVTQQINKLLATRQQHADAIAAIDQSLEPIRSLLSGPIAAQPVKQQAAVAVVAAPKPTKKRRGRKHYGTTGEESILGFVNDLGAPTTKEIKQHWQSEGRKGSSDNVLSLMVKAGKIKRTAMKDQPGSRYSVA